MSKCDGITYIRTDRQMDRKTCNTQMDQQADGQTDGQIYRKTQTNRHTTLKKKKSFVNLEISNKHIFNPFPNTDAFGCLCTWHLFETL